MTKWVIGAVIAMMVSLTGSAFGVPADPGIPDSMFITGGPLEVGKSKPLAFSIHNDEQIDLLVCPIRIIGMGGFAALDSMVFVNRMADPSVLDFRFYFPWIDGIPNDSIVVGYNKGSGNPLPIGSDPIVLFYFTGLAPGAMSLQKYITPLGGGPQIVASGNNAAIGVAVPPLSVSVILPPPVPTIQVSASLTRVVCGDLLELPLNYGSPEGLSTTAVVQSVAKADGGTGSPAIVPTIVEGDSPKFQWSTTVADRGIWNVTLRASNTQALYTDVTFAVQVVDDAVYIIETDVVSNSVNAKITSMAVGNFDELQQPDLFVSTNAVNYAPGTRLYGVNSSGFTQVFTSDPDYIKYGLQSGFLDGDNDLDAVCAGYGKVDYYVGWCIQSYLADGQGQFNSSANKIDGTATRGSALGEFTGDSWLDYAVTVNNVITIFPSKGNGTFSTPFTMSVTDTVLTLNAADFDSDGDDDLAVGSRNGMRIYRQTSPRTFVAGSLYPQTYGSVDIEVTNSGSDFNSDGIFDLCVATPSVGGAQSQMMVYFGHTDGSFTQTLIRTLDGQIAANCVGDFNNDTKLDIAFCNSSMRYVGIIFGDGAGNFDNEIRYPIPSLMPHHLECLDYDLDGDLDLVAAASGSTADNALFLLTNQLDPPGFSYGNFSVNAFNNAQVTIFSPSGGQLSSVCNTIPASRMYRRDSDGNLISDSYASLSVIEAGEYAIRVMPRPNLPAGSTFSLEYGLQGQKYRLARNCVMQPAGYEFGVPLSGSSISPQPGSFVKPNIGSLRWVGSGQFDYQLARDLQFQTIVASGTVNGNSVPVSGLSGIDTTTYFWRVKPTGTSSYSKIYAFNVTDAATAVDDDEDVVLPLAYALEQNYPNPFNPTTQIQFTVAKPVTVKLTVTNILGEKVATICDRVFATGRHVVEWHGADQFGRLVPSGVYFYTVRMGDFSATRKMILLK